MINTWTHDDVNSVKNILIDRILSIYRCRNMTLNNQVFNPNTNAYTKQKIIHKLPCCPQGMVDTIRFCLNNINIHNRAFLNMLLKVFNNLIIFYIVSFYIMLFLWMKINFFSSYLNLTLKDK